jgi:capsule polysaccharide modification protein KpsS
MGLNLLEREFSGWPAPAAKQVVGSPRIVARRSEKHFFIVSGPFGPFCTILADRLRTEGARCTRVIANGGDVLDWGLHRAAPYTGTRADWGAWLARRLESAAVT